MKKKAYFSNYLFKSLAAYKIPPIFTGDTWAASGTIKNTTFLMDSEER